MILALALAVLATATAVVAAVRVYKVGAALGEAVRSASARMAPLLHELQEDVAVTAYELEALGSGPRAKSGG